MANQSSNSDINKELKRLQNLLSKKAKVEEELNKISKEKDTLWTAIPDMIFITDNKSKILDFKAEKESELLISPKDVIGKVVDDLPLDSNAKKLFYQSFKRARKNNEVEILNYKAETIGGLGFFEARICPMSDSRFFVIIRNKTEEEIAKYKFIENDKVLKQRTKEIANQNEEYAAANEELVEKNQTISNIMNELRWNETKFRQMFSSSPAGLFYWDTNLMITELNRAFSDALAAPYIKLKGLDMLTLHDKSVLPSIKSAIKGKPGNYIGWYKATISGKRIFIKLSTYPIYSKTDSKKIIGGAGLVEDLTEWKISQEKLEEKEENLRITLQSIADAVIVTDVKGAITNLNPVAEKLIGLKSKKLVGRLLKNVAKLKNSKTGEILPCSVDIAILEGKTISLTKNIEMYPISGFVYNVNFVVSPIYKTEENIIGAVVVIKDVSESYKIQNELYESESRFKSLFENSPTGIALIDINGNIMEVNNEILNILGSPSEAATKKINVLTFESLVNAGFSDDFRKCLLTHKSINRQTDYISKWRKGIIVQYTLSPFIEKNKKNSGVILNIFDVTNQKRLEEKEKKYFHDIEINAKASLELVDLSLDSDIFYFIGEKLKLFAENQTIIVNRISQDQKEYNIEFVFAVDDRLKQFKEIFNRPPQQIATNRNPNLHNRNKFIEIDPEHMLLASGNFDPKGVKKIIEIQEINKTYLFGLYAGDEYVGSIVIFTHKEEVLNNIEIIETFLNQVSLQIQKRQALQKLRDSEELYNNTLNSVSEYIHVTDCNQIILFANTSLKVVLKERGLNDNVAGLTINKAMPFLPNNVIDNYHRVIKTRKPLFSEETTIIKGQIFHTQTILTPVVEFNKVTRVITSMRDVTENKLSEIEISVLKELNESIVQNMNEGICMEDESGNIVMANPAFCRMMEIGLDKLIGKPALDFIPKQIHGMIRIAKLNLSAYKNKSFEIEIIAESGKKVTALHSFGPIYQDNKLKYIVSVFTDISNRKLMEQNLLDAKEKIEESEKKFRDLYEKSGDAILIISNGVFVDCNQAAVEIFKLKHRDEIINTHPSQLSPEIQADGDNSFIKAERMIATALEKGTNRFLWEHKNSNGEIFPAEVLLTSIANDYNEKVIHSVVRDISERRKAEEALHLSEERYRLISTVSSDYMFSTIVKEDDTLELDWVAGAFEAITGYSIKEYKSKGGWRFTLHPEDLLIDKNDFEKLKKNKKVDSEIRTVKKDGKIIWVRVFAHPLWDDKNQKLKGIYGAVQDITDRKSVELEILEAKHRAEESEEKFRNAFEYAAFGIVMVNANGYFMKANIAMSAIIGYTEGELLTKTFSDITHPDDVKIGLDLTMEVLEGKRRYFWLEKRYIHKNGSIIWGRLSVSLINDKQNKFPFVVAQIQDITEQRRTNDALIDSENRLKLISDLTSDYIFQLDVCDDGTVKMSFISENFYNVTGRKVKDVMTPEKWGDVFHPEDFPKLMNCLNQLMLTGETQELEGRTFVKEGRMRWVYVLAKAKFDEQNKKIIAIVGSVNDITERKNAQEALIKSENHLRNILELSNLAMAIISFDGVIEFINNQAVKTFGYLHEDIPTMDCWWKLAYPEENYRKKTIEQFMGLVNRAIVEKGEIERREYYPTCKNGTVKTMIIFGVIVEDKIFVMFEDITERKNAEEQIVNALKKAEESDKLKSAFLANMSHELRTPINGIIGFSNLMLSQNLDIEKKEKYVSQINASSAMLLRLIEDIIDIAKIESGKMVIEKAPCNVSETLNELYLYFKQELKVRNKENILLVYNKHSDRDLTIISDPFRLRQVLNNLISNAVKFTSIGKIEFGFTLKDEKILFYVKDTGIGIEKEYLNQIFDRFTQLEISHSRKFGGTGLGLTISKNIIELLNGEIWVESEAKKGSSFYFTLPAEILETVEEKLNIEVDIKNYNWINRTILIAEDDDLNFMFLEEMLQQTNLKIIRAKNGKEAVDLVHMIPEISLVLMDIQMPVMDGYESTKMINSFKPDLPVIAQTAYAFASEKEMSMKAGCIDYISKPIDQKQLLKKIGKYLKENKTKV